MAKLEDLQASAPDIAIGLSRVGVSGVQKAVRIGRGRREKLIAAMEGMEFDTPKGKMVFRKEDHQALQSMYHFKIKVDPNLAWAVPELVRELKIEDMNVPIRNKR